jgi:hypothetical protein
MLQASPDLLALHFVGFVGKLCRPKPEHRDIVGIS